jgi:hypothetical protein
MENTLLSQQENWAKELRNEKATTAQQPKQKIKKERRSPEGYTQHTCCTTGSNTQKVVVYRQKKEL